MEDLLFLAEQSEEGGYTAKGVGVSIYTQGETIEELNAAIIDAVDCHFDDGQKRMVRLQIMKEEVIAA